MDGIRFSIVLLIGVAATATIACSDEGVTPPPPPPATNLTLSLAEFALVVGGALQLDATVTDASGNPVASPTITWSSSNASVISVQANGAMATVTAVAAGAATITATSDAVNATSAGDVVASAAYSADVQPIFTASCAIGSCHVGPTPQPQVKPMDLSAAVSYDNIVDVASGQLTSMDRIEPGDPTMSYLIHKIRGTQGSVGGTGSQMPLGMMQLPDVTINIIRAWAQDGAQNN